MTDRELIDLAIDARRNSYSPYSGFAVGAALLASDGTVYTGCNIENAAYSPGSCAERTAVFKAASDGKRDFSAIAVVGGHSDGKGVDSICAPCGVCRQVLREFCVPAEFRVLLAPLNNPEKYEVYTLEQLLPQSFGPDDLNI